jgi:glycosyltransferase involved in cell wall biosynthesis
MRIGIDAHGVGGHSLGLGNETYFRNLIAGLLEIDHKNEYHIFINHPEALQELVRNHSNAKTVSLFPRSSWVQRPVSIPIYTWQHGLDLIHVPFIRPPFINAKTVVTVHDANYELFPKDFARLDRWRMKLLVPRSCRKADLIFTVSEFGRRQLHELYDIPLEKIVVTYNAADHLNRGSKSEKEGCLRRLSLPAHFILFVGLIQPKKNLARLVKAFDQVKSRGNYPHHLLLAGKWGWGNRELEKALALAKHREHIQFLGYLSQTEMEAIGPRADLFVFPSLYECFGIPPLEFQRLGVPAMVSNSTCFPEIYGDSVMYCDPMSVDSIADGIERLLSDAPMREEFVKRGFARSRQFSWVKSARIALEAYEKLFYDGVSQESKIVPAHS